MTLTTRIYTALFGELVGADAFGNRYFRRKGAAHGSRTDTRRRDKRWVIYNGIAEPSKVPAEWHGWLHYTFDIPPPERKPSHHAWEKTHMPNLTGTANAYLPQGHLQKTAQHAPTISEYEPWRPT